MKKLYTVFIALLLLSPAFKAKAQGGFSDIIKVSPGDATKLVQAYGDPLFKGFGVGMNSGWANTAKPKKLLHVELRITATAAFTPTSDKTFDVTKIGLSSQDSFMNNQSQPVRWQYIDVAEINQLKDLTDGTELYYQIHEAPDADLYVAWAHHKSALLGVRNLN